MGKGTYVRTHRQGTLGKGIWVAGPGDGPQPRAHVHRAAVVRQGQMGKGTGQMGKGTGHMNKHTWTGDTWADSSAPHTSVP